MLGTAAVWDSRPTAAGPSGAYRARLPVLPEATRYLRSHLLYRDPPDNTRLRRLVSKAFTPRMVEQLRPRVQAIADALLDAVAGRGEMDVIDDYAFPMPITVIAAMLGIRAAARRAPGPPVIAPWEDGYMVRLTASVAAFVRTRVGPARVSPSESEA